MSVTRTFAALVAAAMIATPAIAAPATKADAAASFAALKRLVGTWRTKRPAGRVVSVVYRLTAGGTVLMETWDLGPDRESVTVYHLDRSVLLATHYCPIGNQPRLRLASVDPRHLRFVFLDATGLDTPEESHQHAFGIDFVGDDRIVRTETYVEAGKPDTDTLIFDRVEP